MCGRRFLPLSNTFRLRARGQAMVEFALAVPLFLLLVIAVVEARRVIFTFGTLAHAVNEGARLAALPSTANVAAVKDRVVKTATVVGIDEGNIEVEVEDYSGSTKLYTARATGDRIRVVATHTFEPVVSYIFGAPSMSLHRESEIMAEGQP